MSPCFLSLRAGEAVDLCRAASESLHDSRSRHINLCHWSGGQKCLCSGWCDFRKNEPDVNPEFSFTGAGYGKELKPVSKLTNLPGQEALLCSGFMHVRTSVSGRPPALRLDCLKIRTPVVPSPHVVSMATSGASSTGTFSDTFADLRRLRLGDWPGSVDSTCCVVTCSYGIFAGGWAHGRREGHRATPRRAIRQVSSRVHHHRLRLGRRGQTDGEIFFRTFIQAAAEAQPLVDVVPLYGLAFTMPAPSLPLWTSLSAAFAASLPGGARPALPTRTPKNLHSPDSDDLA